MTANIYTITALLKFEKATRKANDSKFWKQWGEKIKSSFHEYSIDDIDMEVLNELKAIRIKIIQYNRKKNKYNQNYLTAKYANDGQESITDSNLTGGVDCMIIFFDVY